MRSITQPAACMPAMSVIPDGPKVCTVTQSVLVWHGDELQTWRELYPHPVFLVSSLRSSSTVQSRAPAAWHTSLAIDQGCAPWQTALPPVA